MTAIRSYCIVYAEETNGLVTKVGHALIAGFRPLGAPFVDIFGTFYQAMIYEGVAENATPNEVTGNE